MSANDRFESPRPDSTNSEDEVADSALRSPSPKDDEWDSQNSVARQRNSSSRSCRTFEPIPRQRMLSWASGDYNDSPVASNLLARSPTDRVSEENLAIDRQNVPITEHPWASLLVRDRHRPTGDDIPDRNNSAPDGGNPREHMHEGPPARDPTRRMPYSSFVTLQDVVHFRRQTLELAEQPSERRMNNYRRYPKQKCQLFSPKTSTKPKKQPVLLYTIVKKLTSTKYVLHAAHWEVFMPDRPDLRIVVLDMESRFLLQPYQEVKLRDFDQGQSFWVYELEKMQTSAILTADDLLHPATPLLIPTKRTWRAKWVTPVEPRTCAGKLALITRVFWNDNNKGYNVYGAVETVTTSVAFPYHMFHSLPTDTKVPRMPNVDEFYKVRLMWPEETLVRHVEQPTEAAAKELKAAVVAVEQFMVDLGPRVIAISAFSPRLQERGKLFLHVMTTATSLQPDFILQLAGEMYSVIVPALNHVISKSSDQHHYPVPELTDVKLWESSDTVFFCSAKVTIRSKQEIPKQHWHIGNNLELVPFDPDEALSFPLTITHFERNNDESKNKRTLIFDVEGTGRAVCVLILAQKAIKKFCHCRQVPEMVHGELRHLRQFANNAALDGLSHRSASLFANILATTIAEGCNAPTATQIRDAAVVVLQDKMITLDDSQRRVVATRRHASPTVLVVDAAYGTGKTLLLAQMLVNSAFDDPSTIHVLLAPTNAAVLANVRTYHRVQGAKDISAMRLSANANWVLTTETAINLRCLLRQRCRELVAEDDEEAVISLESAFKYIEKTNIDDLNPSNFAEYYATELVVQQFMNKYAKELVMLIKPRVIFATIDTGLNYFSMCQSNTASMIDYADRVANVYIDDAAQLTVHGFASVLATFPNAKCTMVGDTMQLPPFTNAELTKFLAEAGNMSILEKVRLNNSHPVLPLEFVYRGHPDCIYANSIVFYEGRLKPATLTTYLVTPFIFLPSSADHEVVGKSLRNEGEANLVEDHVETLLNGGIQPEDLHVVCIYKAQRSLIRRKLRENNFLKQFKINVLTVREAQGSEVDVTILATTRSTFPNERKALLYDKRYVNLATSRHRRGLIVVGSPELPYVRTWENYLRHTKDMSIEKFVAAVAPMPSMSASENLTEPECDVDTKDDVDQEKRPQPTPTHTI